MSESPRALRQPLPANWPKLPAALPAGLRIPSVDAREVCVLTADSRPMTPYRRPPAYATAYSAYTSQDESQRAYRSATSLSNFWWARRHGYRFIAANATAPTGWAGFWAKLPAIIDTVRRCEWTVRSSWRSR